jgi:hypothetical protein
MGSGSCIVPLGDSYMATNKADREVLAKINLGEAERDANWWSPVLEFLVHTVVGTTLFVLIAAAAIGLGYLVSWLETLRVDRLILWGLMVCEYLLFVADVLFFVVFIVRQAWKGIGKLR